MKMRILLEKFRLDSQSKISLKYPLYIPMHIYLQTLQYEYKEHS